MRKILKTIVLAIGAFVVLIIALGFFATIGGQDEKIKEELGVVDEDHTEVIEKDSQSEAFINDTLSQLVIIREHMEDFADELGVIADNPSLIYDEKTVSNLNDSIDDMERVISIELIQPGNRDGEENAAMYFTDFKDEYTIFLGKLRTGVNEKDSELIIASNEHQTEAVEYFEATINNINIAIENRANK